jgi:hypothetical protein
MEAYTPHTQIQHKNSKGSNLTFGKKDSSLINVDQQKLI